MPQQSIIKSFAIAFITCFVVGCNGDNANDSRTDNGSTSSPPAHTLQTKQATNDAQTYINKYFNLGYIPSVQYGQAIDCTQDDAINIPFCQKRSLVADTGVTNDNFDTMIGAQKIINSWKPATSFCARASARLGFLNICNPLLSCDIEHASWDNTRSPPCTPKPSSEVQAITGLFWNEILVNTENWGDQLKNGSIQALFVICSASDNPAFKDLTCDSEEFTKKLNDVITFVSGMTTQHPVDANPSIPIVLLHVDAIYGSDTTSTADGPFHCPTSTISPLPNGFTNCTNQVVTTLNNAYNQINVLPEPNYAGSGIFVSRIGESQFWPSTTCSIWNQSGSDCSDLTAAHSSFSFSFLRADLKPPVLSPIYKILRTLKDDPTPFGLVFANTLPYTQMRCLYPDDGHTADRDNKGCGDTIHRN